MKMPICFFTFASDLYKPYADKMISSFNKFHHNTPIIFFGQRDIDAAKKEGFEMGLLAPYFGSMLSKEYKTVVSIEADNVVCDVLWEIFESNYDVAIALNNYKGAPGFFLPDVPPDIYANTGIVASTSERFWDLWKKMNTKHASRYRFVEQDVVNNMLAFNDFDLKFLDKDKVFYSSSIRKVWDKLELKDGKLYCAKRLVKVIHWAGGGTVKKFNWRERKFDPAVCDHLDYLTT